MSSFGVYTGFENSTKIFLAKLMNVCYISICRNQCDLSLHLTLRCRRNVRNIVHNKYLIKSKRFDAAKNVEIWFAIHPGVTHSHTHILILPNRWDILVGSAYRGDPLRAAWQVFAIDISKQSFDCSKPQLFEVANIYSPGSSANSALVYTNICILFAKLVNTKLLCHSSMFATHASIKRAFNRKVDNI